MREAELADRLGIGRVEPEGVPVLDDGLAVLLLLEVAVPPVEVARLLRLGGPRASRGQEEGDQEEEAPVASRGDHGFYSVRPAPPQAWEAPKHSRMAPIGQDDLAFREQQQSRYQRRARNEAM